MPRPDPRIDAYIAKAADFAKPILMHIRKTVHNACPGVEEDIKWGAPFFLIDGKNFANMAAFKQHAAFGFWKDVDLPKADEAMGHFGRLTSVEDLPDDEQLMALIRSAADQVRAGSGGAGKVKKPVKLPPLPKDFAEAIAANPVAQDHYDGFSPGNQRDYIEWIIDAKREATRAKRIATAVEWIAEGKTRHWKYR